MYEPSFHVFMLQKGTDLAHCSCFTFRRINHRLRMWKKILKLPWQSLSRKTNTFISYDYGFAFMSSVTILSFSFSLLHVKPQYISNSITHRTLLHLRVVAGFTYLVWKRICCLFLKPFAPLSCFAVACQLASHSARLSQGDWFLWRRKIMFQWSGLWNSGVIQIELWNTELVSQRELLRVSTCHEDILIIIIILLT